MDVVRPTSNVNSTCWKHTRFKRGTHGRGKSIYLPSAGLAFPLSTELIYPIAAAAAAAANDGDNDNDDDDDVTDIRTTVSRLPWLNEDQWLFRHLLYLRCHIGTAEAPSLVDWTTKWVVRFLSVRQLWKDLLLLQSTRPLGLSYLQVLSLRCDLTVVTILT